MPDSSSIPHLTPARLVGQAFGRDTFAPARVALIGYCPPPDALSKYAPQRIRRQPFIHIPPDSVRMLNWEGHSILSLAHVYGGPVSASTVEELAYYGFDWLLAYGLAGAIGDPPLEMGAFYRVDEAFVADGTTPAYTGDRLTVADVKLATHIESHWPASTLGALHGVRAYTADAIYREDDAFIDRARASGCQVVNLDSSHLFAVARTNCEGREMRAIECGVVSDVVSARGSGQPESQLGAMLDGQAAAAESPMDRVSRIVEFYVEVLCPALQDGDGSARR